MTGKIFAHVTANPRKLSRARRFVNYYVPTTIKLLNAYDRMGSQGVEGENIGGTMRKIEDILDTIVTAFEKQLDNLFSEEAMDISADITVLEGMIEQRRFFRTEVLSANICHRQYEEKKERQLWIMVYRS